MVKEKTITYWDCGLGHRHGSEKVATACFNKQKKCKRTKENNKKRFARNIRMTIQVLNGKTFSSVAGQNGICTGSVREISLRMIRHVKIREAREKYGVRNVSGFVGHPWTISSCRENPFPLIELLSKWEMDRPENLDVAEEKAYEQCG